MVEYSLEDICKSYLWLGHPTFTEVVALHPDYKPGEENFEWNKTHKTFPMTWYPINVDGVTNIVRKHHEQRMLCMGLNPRRKVFLNERGYARAAREDEIEVSKNLLLDFDFQNKDVSPTQKAVLDRYLKTEVRHYFFDLGLKEPVFADSGAGLHLLCAYPEVLVKEVPDIKARLRKFTTELSEDHKHELSRLEAKLDNTSDLSRKVKIYGTRKPGVATISRWFGGQRMEDEELRDYLLSMSIPAKWDGATGRERGKTFEISINEELPPSLEELLARDAELRNLWNGQGKPDSSDTSRSGYDFAIVRRLIELGYLKDLFTVLALRPEGSVQNSGKSEMYIRRTIANALLS